MENAEWKWRSASSGVLGAGTQSVCGFLSCQEGGEASNRLGPFNPMCQILWLVGPACAGWASGWEVAVGTSSAGTLGKHQEAGVPPGSGWRILATVGHALPPLW